MGFSPHSPSTPSAPRRTEPGEDRQVGHPRGHLLIITAFVAWVFMLARYRPATVPASRGSGCLHPVPLRDGPYFGAGEFGVDGEPERDELLVGVDEPVKQGLA